MEARRYKKVEKALDAAKIGDEETGSFDYSTIEVDEYATATRVRGPNNVVAKYKGISKVIPKFVLRDIRQMK